MKKLDAYVLIDQLETIPLTESSLYNTQVLSKPDDLYFILL